MLLFKSCGLLVLAVLSVIGAPVGTPKPAAKGRATLSRSKSLVGKGPAAKAPAPATAAKKTVVKGKGKGPTSPGRAAPVAAAGAAAVPSTAQTKAGSSIAQKAHNLIDNIHATDDLIIFDSPAYSDANGNTIVALQTFASIRQIDLHKVTNAVTGFLKTLHVDVGNSLNTFQERVKLLGAIGLPHKSVPFSVPGCSGTAQSGQTAGLPDLGISLKTVNLGKCGAAHEMTATATLSASDKRVMKGSIFFSPNSGFGVISDIDDTIKVSHVLDKAKLIKSTLLEPPKAVPGMPEVYASLAKSLKQPQFVYVSGSPYQLYPFLNSFIDTSYAASKGPILLKNLTAVDPVQTIKFITGSNTQAYKVMQIDRLRAMYPAKKWLMVGDSTEKDPEVYAEAFKKGVNVACIWIRNVDGSANTPARFAAAFAGVPKTKYRVYKDAEIPSLSKVNVAGGQC
ncbi:unnamed protein product [Cyclocybe aegerita]|uniref:Phosphatidate phosphatase APP1 catalytic domain-containing protein n=1 Tax=Cyclocybe aegerita TaxID=1973307 RepID=A0A8S0WR84_CYCAE|nr:unnamed protein product [Cyclocybe aegerita]